MRNKHQNKMTLVCFELQNSLGRVRAGSQLSDIRFLHREPRSLESQGAEVLWAGVAHGSPNSVHLVLRSTSAEAQAVQPILSAITVGWGSTVVLHCRDDFSRWTMLDLTVLEKACLPPHCMPWCWTSMQDLGDGHGPSAVTL